MTPDEAIRAAQLVRSLRGLAGVRAGLDGAPEGGYQRRCLNIESGSFNADNDGSPDFYVHIDQETGAAFLDAAETIVREELRGLGVEMPDA